MGFGIKNQTINTIDQSVTTINENVDTLQEDVSTIEQAVLESRWFLDVWSAPGPTINLDSTPQDVDFPFDYPNNAISVSGLPEAFEVAAAVMMLKVAGIWDTSGSDNYIKNATAGAIRIMKDGGAWGTDDIIGLQLVTPAWYIPASTKRAGGDIVIGVSNIKSVVDGDGTYYFRSEQTNRGDALYAQGDNLILVDVQIGFRYYFRPAQ